MNFVNSPRLKQSGSRIAAAHHPDIFARGSTQFADERDWITRHLGALHILQSSAEDDVAYLFDAGNLRHFFAGACRGLRKERLASVDDSVDPLNKIAHTVVNTLERLQEIDASIHVGDEAI